MRRAGLDVAVFSDPLTALDAIESDGRVELLVTRVDFGPGRCHGISLARVAQNKRLRPKVLFTASPEHEEFAVEAGEVVPYPIAPAALVQAVQRMLARDVREERDMRPAA